jgi:hypothetical protein
MHALFNLEPKAQTGVQIPALWPYVKQGLRANVAQIISYYRSNPQAVKSDHLLVKIIQSMDMPLSLNYDRYFSLVDASALDLSMVLKLTSSLYKGQVWDGVFYGPGSREILVAYTGEFDYNKVQKEWQNVAAVRVLRHAKSDLYMNLPDGNRNTTESGLCVIGINIALLMCQYYWFRKSYWIEDHDLDTRTTMMFIHMYVLPNMLFSHLDQALFNRIQKLSKHETLGQSIKRHPFAQVSYEHKVDQCYVAVLENLKRQEKNFAGILQNVPAAIRSDMNQVMRVPDMAPTRQVVWALAISRLEALDFVLSQVHRTPQTKNQSEVDAINRTFLFWKNARIFEGVMPADVQADVIGELNAVLQKANPSQNEHVRGGLLF